MSSEPIPAPPADDRSFYDIAYRRHAQPMTAFAQERGLFELLENGPRDFDSIAEGTGTEGRVTETMLAVATALGFLERELPGAWALSEYGRTYLCPSSPFYYGPLLSPDHPDLVELRRACIEERGPTRPLAVAIEELPEQEVQAFIARMHRITLPAASALARNPVFATVERLLDVAAGSGSLSIGIASGNATLRGTLLDVPAVCRIAEENIAAYDLEGRLETLAADMFQDDWPGGHDSVLFGNIFHDWDMESCRRLATRAFGALEPGGRVFLHEALLDEDKGGPLTVACFSVAMLLFERGRQFTAKELFALLEEAGFVDCQADPSYGYYSLVSARKP